jgi:hypothetical protein
MEGKCLMPATRTDLDLVLMIIRFLYMFLDKMRAVIAPMNEQHKRRQNGLDKEELNTLNDHKREQKRLNNSQAQEEKEKNRRKKL